jgi:hypothetical protein
VTVIVYLYLPEYQHFGNTDKHNRAISIEDQARDDGFNVQYYESNGFLSGVEFVNEDDAIKFIFKYLR